MKSTLLKLSISTAAALTLFGCSSSTIPNDEHIGYCKGKEFDADANSCLNGHLVDACNDKNIYTVMQTMDASFVCRGDSSWTEASKNESYFQQGCDKGNEDSELA